jgi:hypothetical protein
MLLACLLLMCSSSPCRPMENPIQFSICCPDLAHATLSAPGCRRHRASPPPSPSCPRPPNGLDLLPQSAAPGHPTLGCHRCRSRVFTPCLTGRPIGWPCEPCRKLQHNRPLAPPQVEPASALMFLFFSTSKHAHVLQRNVQLVARSPGQLVAQ